MSSFRTEPHMSRRSVTLGDWRDTLRMLPKDLRVTFDQRIDYCASRTVFMVPSDLECWRGDYSDLTLTRYTAGGEVSGDLSALPTVAELLEDAEHAIGHTFRCNGGEYVMNEDTTLWADASCEADQVELLGVSLRSGIIVVGTSDPYV